MLSSHQIAKKQVDYYFVVVSAKEQGHGITGMHGTHAGVLRAEAHLVIDLLCGYTESGCDLVTSYPAPFE